MRASSITGSVIGVVTLLAAATVDAQPRWGRPSFPRDGACFYRDKNYQGDYFCTDAGQDIAVMPNGMNDAITSIRTFGNVEVTLYKEGRFRGRSIDFRGDVRNVGDNLNDVEMLDFAGAAYVMGNATDALKSRGYRATGTNDEGGLATAIRECLRQAP